MWMMGCSTSDSLHNRNLRPLFQRLPTDASAPSSSITTAFSSCCLPHKAHRMEALLPVLTQCTSTKCTDVHGRREPPGSCRSGTSRWNPTKEQLRALEELYERGTRTPPAHQIQLIAAQLRRYGRIEGKNVFYWFQNHKARERQRLRRQAEEVGAASSTATSLTAAGPHGGGATEICDKQGWGGAAAAPGRAGCSSSGVAGVLKQESKSSSPATSAAAGGRGEGPAYPWLPSQQQQQSWPQGNAAAPSSSSSSSNNNNNKISWRRNSTRRAPVQELAGRANPTTLQLFPLSSEREVVDVSSSLPRKPTTSPHVQFFQFL